MIGFDFNKKVAYQIVNGKLTESKQVFDDWIKTKNERIDFFSTTYEETIKRLNELEDE